MGNTHVTHSQGLRLDLGLHNGNHNGVKQFYSAPPGKCQNST